MKLHEKIIHEFNVAHSMDCNQQARVRIENICTIEKNEDIKKWNELGIWLINNKTASVGDIVFIRTKLNEGESIRGYQVGNIWGVK